MPSRLIGGNGDPDAKSTRPSVASKASWKVHSDLEVGFERGKMIGRGLFTIILRIISAVKAPLMVETPISTVGFKVSIASSRVAQKGTSWANASLWA